MKTLSVTTNKKNEVVDITDRIEQALGELSAAEGICHLFLTHTTAALATADLDPGTDLDMLDAFRAFIPKLHYRHPHNPSHVPSHILSSLIGTSLSLPITGGRLVLGAWQRVVLFEFDGPRTREILMGVYGSTESTQIG